LLAGGLPRETGQIGLPTTAFRKVQMVQRVQRVQRVQTVQKVLFRRFRGRSGAIE
jgi:hypothetical protein